MQRIQCLYEHSALKYLNRLKEDGLIYQQIHGVKGARVKIDGKWTLNFVSAGFLGLHQHPKVLKNVSTILKNWGTSMVIPRLWGLENFNTQLEREIAILVQQQKAITFPSTTHLALDVIPLLAGPEGLILIDERAYPTSLQGAYVSSRLGSKIRYFKHNDPFSLMKAIKAKKTFKNNVIICDGVYSPEGNMAPLDNFLEVAEEFNAFIYVDDTNGIGIFGEFPHSKMPYGYKGGGTPNYFGLNPSKRIITCWNFIEGFWSPRSFYCNKFCLYKSS